MKIIINSLENFKKDFLKLNNKDLSIQDPFSDFNFFDNSKIDEIKGKAYIKAKNIKTTDILKNA